MQRIQQLMKGMLITTFPLLLIGRKTRSLVPGDLVMVPLERRKTCTKKIRQSQSPIEGQKVGRRCVRCCGVDFSNVPPHNSLAGRMSQCNVLFVLPLASGELFGGRFVKFGGPWFAETSLLRFGSSLSEPRSAGKARLCRNRSRCLWGPC